MGGKANASEKRARPNYSTGDRIRIPGRSDFPSPNVRSPRLEPPLRPPVSLPPPAPPPPPRPTPDRRARFSVMGYSNRTASTGCGTIAKSSCARRGEHACGERVVRVASPGRARPLHPPRSVSPRRRAPNVSFRGTSVRNAAPDARIAAQSPRRVRRLPASVARAIDAPRQSP